MEEGGCIVNTQTREAILMWIAARDADVYRAGFDREEYGKGVLDTLADIEELLDSL